MHIIMIFVLAFLIRLINLNQSLWLDETIVAKVVQTIPFHLIPIQFSPGDFHPPLYYLFMSLWSSVWGTSEIALRLPSILFSLITGLFIYKIGFLLKNKQLAVWAAIFFLFNPLIVYFSQEARMYMMATMLLTIVLYHFIKMYPFHNGETKDWIPPPIRRAGMTQKTIKKGINKNDVVLFNLFSVLSIFTFYGSAFFIAGMIVAYCVISTKRSAWRDLSTEFTLSLSNVLEMTRNIFNMTWGLVLAIFLLSPLLYQQIMNARIGLVDVKNWSMVLGKAELKNVAMIFLKFATGRISWFPKWSYYLIAGIPTAVVWLSVLIGMRKNKLFAYLFILPLLFGLFVSFWAPMMMYFRFLYLIPVMSLLLATAVISTKSAKSDGRMERSQVLRFLDGVYTELAECARNDKSKYAILFIFISFSLIYLLFPQFHREDWKKLTTTLNPNSRMYMILPSSDPITYYRNNLPVYELRDIEHAVIPEFISIIPYTSEIYGFDYHKILQSKGCLKKSEMKFRGDLSVEEWECLKKA